MAILQLSRITHRKGLQENLPQLAGAELGWVLDQRQLFIGNGTIEDGAPEIGNTEILTEYSDILALSSTYTYKGATAGYVVTTGEAGEDVVRSLQEKFDDMVSVKDFGAEGDGTTDDTDAINRALFELFCRETNTEIRRSLFFPAGTYKVSGTIKIPPHAKLYGEGLTSSIIKFVAGASISVTTITAGTRYAITDPGDTDFTLIGAANSDADTVFTATGVGAGTGTVREVPAYVVTTADSLQQTGVNIGVGATPPTGIEMSSMAVYSDEENTLLLLDTVTNSAFNHVGLHGPRDGADILANAVKYETSAVEIATSTGPTHDVTISKLDTQGTTYALKAEGDVKGVVLEDSGMDYHYKGVYVKNDAIASTAMVNGVTYKIVATNEVSPSDFTLVGAPDNNVGTTFTATGSTPGQSTVISLDDPSPTGIVVARNIFDNIAYEGVHFEYVLFNSSGFNVFYDVANNLGGEGSAIAPVVLLETDKCASIGDLFEREDETVHPRIELAGNGGIAIDSTHSIHLGAYERQTGIEANLGAGLTTEPLFTINSSVPNTFQVDYVISDTNKTRGGRLTVSNDGATVTYNEEYTESTDLEIELIASYAGTASTELQFTSTAIADRSFTYSIVQIG